MLSQYTMPEMGKVFSLENRYQLMTDVTVTVCEALADIGYIPNEDYKIIKERAVYDVKRVEELEQQNHQNTLSLLLCLVENIGGASSRYIHLGACASDISDCATALQVKQACDLIQSKLNQLREILARMAHEYKYTLISGRTHGTHSEPTTFGLIMAQWVKEIDRNQARLSRARNIMTVGKINGVVGTFSSIDPSVEIYVCRRLGLQRAEVSNQIIQRDRMAEFITTLAIIGSSLEKFATEIRNLQRTEIREVEEDLAGGQSRSSSMPHKRRPFRSEVISGLARLLRSNSLAAMEDITVWHEQDSTHSAVERIIFPDSCILVDYMLAQFISVMDNLGVFPEAMIDNIEKSLGLVFSQRVLLALLEKGVKREEAYELVRYNAEIAWSQQGDFQYRILEDPEIGKYLTRQEIMDLFDYNYFINRVDYIFQWAGI